MKRICLWNLQPIPLKEKFPNGFRIFPNLLIVGKLRKRLLFFCLSYIKQDRLNTISLIGKIKGLKDDPSVW